MLRRSPLLQNRLHPGIIVTWTSSYIQVLNYTNGCIQRDYLNTNLFSIYLQFNCAKQSGKWVGIICKSGDMPSIMECPPLTLKQCLLFRQMQSLLLWMFLDEKNIEILHFNVQIFTYEKGAVTVGICEYLLQVAMIQDRKIGIPFSTWSRSGPNSEVPFCQLVKCITEGALKRVRWKSPIYKQV